MIDCGLIPQYNKHIATHKGLNMRYTTQAEQLALFSTVLLDPVAAVPEVMFAMEQIVTPHKAQREVVVEGNLFESVIEAAYWLHFDSPHIWVKAQGQKVQNLAQINKNLQNLVHNRCKAHRDRNGVGHILKNWFYADDVSPAAMYTDGVLWWTPGSGIIRDWRGRASRR
jgi:hypothetical protein